MPSGIAIPVHAVAGRSVLLSGDDQNMKVLQLACSDGASLNPFPSLGVPSPAFQVGDKTFRTIVESRIRAHFRRFEAAHRMKLEKLTFRTTSIDGTMEGVLRYVDLRTDRSNETVVKVG